MSRLYLVPDGAEVVRRRKLLAAGTLVEAWPDLEVAGHLWLGSDTKALLDAVGDALPVRLSLEARHVPIYYGPRLADLEALPTEESLRARVVSAHGISVAWVTVDRFGQRTGYQPQGPSDPTFSLRRPRTTVSHLWRMFGTRIDACAYLREFYGNDPEAQEWAASIAVASYAELIERASP